MGSDLDGVKKESQAVWAKISHLEGKVKALDEEIEALQQEVNDVTEKRDKAFANIKELRKQRDEGVNLFSFHILLIFLVYCSLPHPLSLRTGSYAV